MNGLFGSGRLQIYDLDRDSHVDFIEAAPQNVISRTQQKQLSPTVIERVVVRRTAGHC